MRDLTVDHDVAAVREPQRHARVLLDQEHGRRRAGVEIADDLEDLPHDQRRQTERGLVEQQQLAAGPSARGRSPASAARRPRACRRAGSRRSSKMRKQRETLRRDRPRTSRRRCGLSIAPICRFSSTVMRGKMRRPSATARCPAARSRASACCVMSRPSKTIVPARARGLPQMVIISVVLPAPLAPISVTISPGATCKLDAFERLDPPVVGVDGLGPRAAAPSCADLTLDGGRASSSSTPR